MGTTANGLPQRPRAPEGSQLFPVPYICSRARCGQSETPLSGPLCPFLNALAGILITQSVGGGCYRRSLMAFLCCLVSCPVAFHMVKDIKERCSTWHSRVVRTNGFVPRQGLHAWGGSRAFLHHLGVNQTTMHLCLPESLCSSPTAHLTWSSCGEMGVGCLKSKGAPGLLC